MAGLGRYAPDNEAPVVRIARLDTAAFATAVVLTIRLYAVEEVAGLQTPVADRLTIEGVRGHAVQEFRHECLQMLRQRVVGQAIPLNSQRTSGQLHMGVETQIQWGYALHSRCESRAGRMQSKCKIVHIPIHLRKSGESLTAWKSGGIQAFPREVQRIPEADSHHNVESAVRQGSAGDSERRQTPAEFDHVAPLTNEGVGQVGRFGRRGQNLVQFRQLLVRGFCHTEGPFQSHESRAGAADSHQIGDEHALPAQ